VNCASGVCTVSASACIGPRHGWKSSRGVSSNVHTSRGRVGAVATIASIAGVPVTSVAEAGISVAWVAAISQNVGISLSLPLGDMDNPSRVGNVSSSTGISSSDSRDGSRGSSQGGERGGGGNIGVAGSNRGDSSDVSNSRGSVAKTGIAVAQTSVPKTTVSETGVAKTIGTVESISLSLSLPLGDMDDTSRVGNVTSSTGVSSSDSRDGSRGKASNVHGSRGGHTGVASSIGGNSSDGSNSSSNRGHSGNSRGSVAKTSVSESSVSQTGVSKTGVAKTVGTVVSIRLSLSLPLGDMDDSGRVGDVTSSGSVASSDSGDGGSGEAGNRDGGGGGDGGVAGGNDGGGVSVAVGSKAVCSVGSKATVVASKSIASISSVQEVGVGLSLRGSHSGHSHAGDSKELVHLDVVLAIARNTTHWSSEL